MPKTRAQTSRKRDRSVTQSPSPSPEVEPSPKKKNHPSGADSASGGPFSDAAGGSNVQSSIPGMTIAEIRSILGEQRKQFQENGYVSIIDEVYPNMSRLEFDYRYVYGIAVKRHAKHKRASAKQTRSETQVDDDDK